MSNVVLNWSPDDLINVGIMFGFFLGCFTWLCVNIGCKIEEYIKNRKRDKQ